MTSRLQNGKLIDFPQTYSSMGSKTFATHSMGSKTAVLTRSPGHAEYPTGYPGEVSTSLAGSSSASEGANLQSFATNLRF